MKYQLAAAAAILAIGVAPAYAQNSTRITGSDVPLANGGMRPNINAPGANGSDAPNALSSGPMSGSASSSASTGATSSGAGAAGNANSTESTTSARTDMSNATTLSGGSSTGAAPGAYPVCHTRSQDSCRVANSRR